MPATTDPAAIRAFALASVIVVGLLAFVAERTGPSTPAATRPAR